MDIAMVLRCRDTGKVTLYQSGTDPDAARSRAAEDNAKFTLEKASQEIQDWRARGRAVKEFCDRDYDKLGHFKDAQVEME